MRARVVESPNFGDPYSRLDTPGARRKYYEDNGYLVSRRLIPEAVCDAARMAFEREVKPFKGFLYRQASANPERHVLTEHGYMLNSLLNIQDFDAVRFGGFRTAGLNVFTHPRIQEMVGELLGEPGTVVQSMYFEGNPVTWAHQDTYYLDGEPLGSMAAAWVALEDISPGAGRFYVCPGSHRIEMAKNGGDFDIAFHHERYKALVQQIIKDKNLECRAPALKKGDVLFWSSKTIHGSLPTTEPSLSRSSITAHYIRSSGHFIQYQTRARYLAVTLVNGQRVHEPKSQNRWQHRLMLRIETLIPGPYQFLKRAAVKLLTR